MKTGNDDGGDSLPTVAGREGLTVAKREIRRDGNGWHGLIPKPEGLARGRACIGRGDGLEDDVDRAGWAASLAGVHEQPIAWALIRPGRRSREEGGGGRRKREEGGGRGESSSSSSSSSLSFYRIERGTI